MTPDPSSLSSAQWTEMTSLLISLGLFVGAMIAFAGSILLGHVLIPSLVGTKHLPVSLLKLRPAFYITGLIFFGGAIYLIVRIVNLTDVIGTFYDRWLI